MRKVGIEKGAEWIGEGFGILRKHPAEFLLMGLIYTGISLIPYGFGMLVILLLGPALMGGMIHASRQAADGLKPRVGALFHAFQDGDRIGSYIALCLPVVAFVILLIFLFMPVFIPLGHALQNAGVDTSDPGNSEAVAEALKPILASMVGHVLVLMVITVVLGFLTGMLLFLASARIMLAHEPAFRAMRSSFLACKRNFGAYFILMLLVAVTVFTVQIMFSLMMPRLLVVVLTSVPINALWGPVLYSAHQSIFATDAPVTDDAPPPSPTTHTFEA